MIVLMADVWLILRLYTTRSTVHAEIHAKGILLSRVALVCSITLTKLGSKPAISQLHFSSTGVQIIQNTAVTSLSLLRNECILHVLCPQQPSLPCDCFFLQSNLIIN